MKFDVEVLENGRVFVPTGGNEGKMVADKELGATLRGMRDGTAPALSDSKPARKPRGPNKKVVPVVPAKPDPLAGIV